MSKVFLVGSLVIVLSTAASAHVALNEPNGGEVLVVGSEFTITWTILIAHNLQNWDLSYSTTGANGPWTSIAMNLPPGSGAVGSVHTYVWTVPEAAISNMVRVRVIMDNSGTDYLDISNGNLAVVPPPPVFVRGDCNSDGTISLVDAITVLGYLFGGDPAPTCLDACEFDDNNDLGLADGIGLLSHLFTNGPPPAIPFPDCGVDPTLEGPGCELSTPGCP